MMPRHYFLLLPLFYFQFTVSAQHKSNEALLILPGFGSKINGLGPLKRHFKNFEMPVYIAKYISRKSISASVENLDVYFKNHHLEQYDTLHVLAYIVGSWTLNQWIIEHGKANIKTIIYDRSPLQERAPFILLQDLKWVNFLLFGPITRDLINTPYPVLKDSTINKGIFIETFATNIVRKYRETAMALGPLNWNVDQYQQPYADFTYLPLNHDIMYTQPEIFSGDLLYFIRHGHFSDQSKFHQPVNDPFIKMKKR